MRTILLAIALLVLLVVAAATPLSIIVPYASVTKFDTHAPVITLMPSVPVYKGEIYVDGGATALDAMDGDVTSRIITTGLPLKTTTADTQSVTYSVSDLAGNVAVRVRSVPVLSAVVTTKSLGYARRGISYRIRLAASWGTTPYTWSLETGKLPPGITLSSAGVLSGKPTKSGTWRFSIRTTDAASRYTIKWFSLRVSNW